MTEPLIPTTPRAADTTDAGSLWDAGPHPHTQKDY